MSSKKPEKIKLTEDKAVIHLNAMLTAIQYIDDLVQLSGDQDISQTLIQSTVLPSLETKYGLIELKRHFMELQYNKQQETVLKAGSLPNHFKIVQIFKQLLQQRSSVEWFTVRIDEKLHQATNYYDIIPFGMCFSIIAARLHANLVQAQDLELLQKGDSEELITKLDIQQYGGLYSEQIVILKGEAFITAGHAKDVVKMSRTCYNCVSAKPQHYSSVQECIRDFVLIGLNCKIYNKNQQNLFEIGNDLIKDIKKLFEQEFEQKFDFIDQTLGFNFVKLEKIIEQQKKWKESQWQKK